MNRDVFKRLAKYLLFSSFLSGVIFPQLVTAQLGGLHTFEFVDLPQSARVASLGGLPIAMIDADVNLGSSNPALINDSMSHHISVNHNFHLADISYGNMGLAIDIPRYKTTLLAGINYVSYGDFVRADEFGNRIGEFSGRELAISLGFGRNISENIRFGVQSRFLNSRLESFDSYGMAFDIGVLLQNPQNRENFALVVRNVGFQINAYNSNREKLPIDLQFGYSKRLKHLPFRFMISAHNLFKWDIRSESLFNTDPVFIDQVPQEPSPVSVWFDNLFRHLVFGGELSLGQKEVFRIRAGYNHNMKKELAVSGFRSFSGLSYGFGFRIKKIQFDYGVGTYHLAGGVNHLSITINLNELASRI